MDDTDESLILSVWNILSEVNSLTFHFQPKDGEKAFGAGFVRVEKVESNCLIYHEKGVWQNQKMNFYNVVRWTLGTNWIRFERLRFDAPIFINFIAEGKRTLISEHQHVCGKDTYFCSLVLKNHTCELNWKILGPKKNDFLTSSYIKSNSLRLP